jgi:hypothetical protein
MRIARAFELNILPWYASLNEPRGLDVGVYIGGRYRTVKADVVALKYNKATSILAWVVRHREIPHVRDAIDSDLRIFDTTTPLAAVCLGAGLVKSWERLLRQANNTCQSLHFMQDNGHTS